METARAGFSGWRRLESDAQRIRIGNREVELLKSDDATVAIFHQHDFIAGFFADVFLRAIGEPHRERLAVPVVEHFYFGHIRVTRVPSAQPA